MAVDNKLLSLVITGRNDNYCGNFRERMELAINYLVWSAAKLNLLSAIELVVVDWNSEQPLHEVLELSKDAIATTRFVRVPPAIAALHHSHPEQTFHSTKATNSGLLRSRGQYAFVAQADSIISQASLLNLYYLLSGKFSVPYPLNRVIFKIGRKMIPYQVMGYRPLDVESLDRYLADCASTLYYGSNPRFTAGLSAIGARKSLWDESRGFSEELGGWGFNDIEFGLRMQQLYYGLELSYHGVLFYDLEQEASVYQAGISKMVNPHVYPDCLSVNQQGWGLCNEVGVLEYAAAGSVSEPTQQHCAAETSDSAARPDNLVTLDAFLDTASADRAIGMSSMELLEQFHRVLSEARPRHLAEFGLTEVSFAVLSVLANNTLDLYFFSDWRRVGREAAPNLLTPERLGKLLRDRRHRGRCEFFHGETAATVERYSTKWTHRPDLILFQAEGFARDEVVQNMERALSLLDAGAKLVIIGASPEAFQRCIDFRGLPKLSIIEAGDYRLGVTDHPATDVIGQNAQSR
jgi:hypothetical protein